MSAKGLPSKREFKPTGLPVEGQVQVLAFHPDGCRELQFALQVSGDQRREQLAAELRSHVAEAVRSPHANYVVQKCIQTLRPEAFQFMIDELMSDSILSVAHHKFGCRVLQRIMENGTDAQVRKLGEVLLEHIDELARHPFGNYVVQHLLGYGDLEHRRRAMSRIEQSSSTLCRDPFGSAAVRAVLASELDAERALLARKIAKDKDLLLHMVSMRPSHTTVCQVIQALEIPERKALAQELGTSQALANSKYGWAVFHSLGLSPPPRSSKVRGFSRVAASAVIAGA